MIENEILAIVRTQHNTSLAIPTEGRAVNASGYYNYILIRAHTSDLIEMKINPIKMSISWGRQWAMVEKYTQRKWERVKSHACLHQMHKDSSDRMWNGKKGARKMLESNFLPKLNDDGALK